MTADVGLEMDMRTEAMEFLEMLERDHVGLRRPGSVEDSERIAEVRDDIARTGTYEHTIDELLWGARIAWRNTPRCVGKFYWRGLRVRDRRHLETAEEIFDALVDHLRVSYSGGRVRLLMTVFAARRPGADGIRIWNSQLVRYAGYRQSDGSIVGDPDTLELTEKIRALGWSAPGGRFDVLPLVIQLPGGAPRLFELPADVTPAVSIVHPEFDWFTELDLRWHAFPTISDQCLRIGGLDYPAAPFSAWYTAAEIGARNLGDVGRYNMLPVVAERMGLDTRSDRTLWKDRALVELTIAVLHSFDRAGVSMIDHHFASRAFVQHEEREAVAGRSTAAHWELIVPPIGGSATPLWQRRYQPTIERPNFFAQPVPHCPYHQ